jgi:hypothetical protein
MNTIRSAAALCAAFLCLAAPLARANETPADAAPTTAAQPSPTAVALTRRYFKAIHFDTQMKALTKNVMPIMINAMADSYPNLTAAQRDIIEQAVEESMPAFADRLLEKTIPIYASTFTEQELTDIVAFYESPSGRAIIDKAPAMAPKIIALLPSVMPEFQADIKRRICRKLGCPTDRPAKTNS